MKSDIVRLFQTLPHPCGYYAERTAQNLVIDPASPLLPQIYAVALSKG
ncbi:MAG: arginyltransferase, partial [Rudaea sp.]